MIAAKNLIFESFKVSQRQKGCLRMDGETNENIYGRIQ